MTAVKLPRTQTGLHAIVLLRRPETSRAEEFDCIVGRKTRGANFGKHVLPGGGARHGQDLLSELRREVVSETGYSIMPVHPEPLLIRRTAGNHFNGRRFKLFVVCTEVPGSPRHKPKDTELHPVCPRSIGYILGNFAAQMAPAHLEAVRQVYENGTLGHLLNRSEWPEVRVNWPHLPPEALEPLPQLCAAG